MKDALRQQLITARQAVTQEEWKEGDARRNAFALDLLQQRRPGVLAIYASRDGEPGTHDIITGASDAGWQVLLPVITKHVAWAPFTGWDDMGRGRLHIPQPVGHTSPAGALARATIIITSCLAVSIDGARLGTGAGWWDSALPHRRSGTAVWSLARAVEVLDHIPTHAHDVAVNAVITEAGFRSLA